MISNSTLFQLNILTFENEHFVGRLYILHEQALQIFRSGTTEQFISVPTMYANQGETGL